MLEYVIVGGGVLAIVLHDKLGVSLPTVARLSFAAFVTSAFAFIVSHLVTAGPLGLFEILGGLYIPVAFVFAVSHSCLHVGGRRTGLLFSIALSLGLLSELIGTAYGWIFGAYRYNSPTFFFGLVPFLTPFSWAVIIYMSYGITNAIFVGLAGTRLTAVGKALAYGLMMALALSCVDGLVAVNLDLILDPVSVAPQIGGWTWIGAGPYFGIPLTNFLGWFAVVFGAMALYRSISVIRGWLPLAGKRLDLLIPLMYLLYFLIHAALAISISRLDYVLIGLGTMIPFCLISLLAVLFTAEKERGMDQGRSES